MQKKSQNKVRKNIRRKSQKTKEKKTKLRRNKTNCVKMLQVTILHICVTPLTLITKQRDLPLCFLIISEIKTGRTDVCDKLRFPFSHLFPVCCAYYIFYCLCNYLKQNFTKQILPIFQNARFTILVLAPSIKIFLNFPNRN